jgi:hypothetical protein
VSRRDLQTERFRQAGPKSSGLNQRAADPQDPQPALESEQAVFNEISSWSNREK